MAIRILDPDVVNRIAAGEVLERPANLIKELIENSLDAGAKHLEIDVADGGRTVTIRDDGAGIAAAELPLAIERHATSKITASEDLYHLASYGFRGEALASVAAVSRLSLTSRRANEPEAARLDVEFGRAGEVTPTSANFGTEVRVRDLFENVPARRRFLKSDAAEIAQIKTTLKAVALSRPDVGFVVRAGGTLLFRWPPGQSTLDRALEILPARRLFAGEANVDGVTARVWVGSPDDTQKVSRHVWTFVRERWVQDRALVAAVNEGYRNLLMHGEFPVALVQIEIAPEEVDVNVHPTKAQVKFRDPSVAFRAVCRAVRGILETAPWLDHARPATTATATAAAPAPPSIDVRPPSFLASAEPATAGFDAPEFRRTQYSNRSFPLAATRQALASLDEVDPIVTAEPRPAPARTPEHFRWADLQVIGQIDQTYVVAQNDEAYYLVDQHAAHERVVFERLMASFRGGQVEVQNLLLPLTFDLSLEETEALEAAADDVAKTGLVIERAGPETIAVRALPAAVRENAVSGALQRLAHELNAQGGSLAWERAIGDVFASMACHSVVRAGQPQSEAQMRSLLAQMDEHPLSSFCPHGRPVFVRRAFREVERDFGRIT